MESSTKYGDNHWEVARALNNRVQLLIKEGKLEEVFGIFARGFP